MFFHIFSFLETPNSSSCISGSCILYHDHIQNEPCNRDPSSSDLNLKSLSSDSFCFGLTKQPIIFRMTRPRVWSELRNDVLLLHLNALVVIACLKLVIKELARNKISLVSLVTYNPNLVVSDADFRSNITSSSSSISIVTRLLIGREFTLFSVKCYIQMRVFKFSLLC